MKSRSTYKTLWFIATLLNAAVVGAAPSPEFLPTISASLSISGTESAKCTPTTCTKVFKARHSISHVLQLTPVQESALQSDTSVTIMGVPLLLGDDPNFQNGDTSAKITAVVPIFAEGPSTFQAKLSWKNGVLKIRLKGKADAIVVYDNGLPTLTRDTKDAPAFPLNTRIENTSGTILETTAYLRVIRKESAGGGINPDNSASIKARASLKSVGLTAPPAPI